MKKKNSSSFRNHTEEDRYVWKDDHFYDTDRRGDNHRGYSDRRNFHRNHHDEKISPGRQDEPRLESFTH